MVYCNRVRRLTAFCKSVFVFVGAEMLLCYFFDLLELTVAL